MIISTTSPRTVLVLSHAQPTGWDELLSLQDVGCRVEWVATVDDAVQRVAAIHPDLVVVNEPWDAGRSVQSAIQMRTCLDGRANPIFIVTSWSDRDLSPTDPRQATRQLIHQIAGLLRADPAMRAPTERIDCQGLCLDRDRYRVTLGERLVRVTPTEFRLLWELASRPGYVVSRTDLAAATKGTRRASVPTRTIDAHVKSIRRKLGEHAQLVETVHGVGYRFQEPRWPAESAPRMIR